MSFDVTEKPSLRLPVDADSGAYRHYARTLMRCAYLENHRTRQDFDADWAPFERQFRAASDDKARRTLLATSFSIADLGVRQT